MILDALDMELRSGRAWTAEVEGRIGDWRLFGARGFSRRINACWPYGPPGIQPDAAIDAVETWCRDRGLRPAFKLPDGLGDPADLADRLAARGYAAEAETLLMTGPATGAADPAVRFQTAADAAFEAAFAASSPSMGDARERLGALGRLPQPLLARIDVGGAAACVGACAIDADWAGLFGMRTAPSHRRQGLGRRLLGALLREAADRGAARAYLQVEADNDAALSLYASSGFERAYAYRYWVKAD